MLNADAGLAKKIIESYDGPGIRIMEVCGTHTHEIFRYGIRNILPKSVRLISGPGCPVCVTPVGYIDEAVMLALEHNAVICTFGDLVRVPGTEKSLADARAEGARIRIVYSPADAAAYAKENPSEQVVFLSVGFETTTPGSCLSVRRAAQNGLKNYSILTANKTMDNAYRMLKGTTDAFLFPGHVSAITGTKIYEQLKEEGIYGTVTGFTAGEILTALAYIIRKVRDGGPFFENCYTRVVSADGSPAARKLMADMMDRCDAEWRGLGRIPGSGLALNDRYADFDARLKFSLPEVVGRANPVCRCGDVLTGSCRPDECAAFGKACTPEHPVGACMVSNEGACSAYYRYGGDMSL